MGIFYNPPQPPTANNAGTPPEPHVPVGTQGNPPPRYSTALMLVAVLASWPADLEPRLSKPNNQQQRIAPLTLTYGQQPPVTGTATATEYALIAGAWPADLEPRLSAPNNLRQKIAPLTLRYGDPPAIVGASAIDEAVIVGSWPADLEPRLGAPNNQQQHIAPLTLVYGDRPTPIGTSVPRFYQSAIGAWPQDLEPRLAAPNNARVSVAPLTLRYGSQPSPTPPLNTPEFQAISAWPQPEWSAQSAPRSTAWIAPPNSIPYVPFPYGLVLSNWPADLEPRLGGPNERQQKIAPLTLTYGQAPPIIGTRVPFAALWRPDEAPTPTGRPSVAWLPPLVTVVPFTTYPYPLVASWQVDPQTPPRPVTIAPLTLTYGQSPPPIAPLSPTSFATVLLWQAGPDTPQASPKSAAWNVPAVIVPAGAFRWGVIASWQEAPALLVRQVRIAPLTLPSGNEPPRQAALSRGNVSAIASWVGEPWRQVLYTYRTPDGVTVAGPALVRWTQEQLAAAGFSSEATTTASLQGERLRTAAFLDDGLEG